MTTAFLNDPAYSLYKLHQTVRDARRRARFSRAKSSDPRKELAGLAEHRALVTLRNMGYQVSRRGYNAPFDLWCEGARVEVKAASFSSGRYAAAIRNHDADLLLFACRTPGGALDWFVIPSEAYADVGHIAIWSEDAAAYGGKWMEYHRAWWWVDAIVNSLPAHRGWQPSLL